MCKSESPHVLIHGSVAPWELAMGLDKRFDPFPIQQVQQLG